MSGRLLSRTDLLIIQLDRACKTLIPGSVNSQRPHPDQHLPEKPLSASQKKHIAGLMRINHTGEVCAQGLYQGQTFTAHHPEIGDALEHAAIEELDHLVWCEKRILQLGYRTSRFNLFWYFASLTIGALAGLAGDAVNLGFLAETEARVQSHLETHLQQLPPSDLRTRSILRQMHADEQRHADMALAAGGRPLPRGIGVLMYFTAKIMTTLAYYF